MSGHGRALQLAFALRHWPQLAPVTLPLHPPHPGPLIVHGLASTLDTDLRHQKMHGWAMTWRGLPELRYRHGERAGEILSLEYDTRGQLLVRARVEHELAKRAAGLSVGIDLRRFEIVQENGAEIGLICEAELTEISLTPQPCNHQARVTLRYSPSPTVEFLSAMQVFMQKVSDLVKESQRCPQS